MEEYPASEANSCSAIFSLEIKSISIFENNSWFEFKKL
jgi:hypothetical protein